MLPRKTEGCFLCLQLHDSTELSAPSVPASVTRTQPGLCTRVTGGTDRFPLLALRPATNLSYNVKSLSDK